MEDAFPALPSLLEDFFGGDNRMHSLSPGLNVPAVNIKEEDDGFEVKLAAPGLTKDDFKVTVDNGMLTVSAQKKHETSKKEKGKYSRYEYNFSSFSRSFSLPENADEDEVKAKYENGELLITLGKKEPAKIIGKEIEIE